MRPVARPSSPPAKAAPAPRPPAGEPGAPAPTTRNEVDFHVSPQASLQAILKAIESAERSFYVETYIWNDDPAGRAVAEALIARKKAVEDAGGTFDAKVLLDWVGARGGAAGLGASKIAERLRAGGVDVEVFGDGYVDFENRLIAPVTHRKLFVADGDRFVTGGRNVGDEYLASDYALRSGERAPSWHDLLVTVLGEETGRIREAFLENWVRAGGRRPEALAPVEPAPGGHTPVSTIRSDPHGGEQEIREAHSALIEGAEREIVVIYPYLSDDRLIAELVAAKRADPKLSVKVLLPGVKEESREGVLYERLNEESAKQLLAAGIEVREFSGGETPRYSHMKALMVDGTRLSVGSANGDARSYTGNHELNVLIDDAEAAARFRKAVVEPDWRQARPLGIAAMSTPGAGERLFRRALEAFDFLL